MCGSIATEFVEAVGCDVLLCEVSFRPSQPLRQSRLATKHENRTNHMGNTRAVCLMNAEPGRFDASIGRAYARYETNSMKGRNRYGVAGFTEPRGVPTCWTIFALDILAIRRLQLR